MVNLCKCLYLRLQVIHALLSAIDSGTVAQVVMSFLHLSIHNQPSGRLRDPPVGFART